MIPKLDFIYQETYNASEGYFACQNDYETNDLLLFLDAGVFYEFLPLDKLNVDHSAAVRLQDVEKGKNYVLIISTNAGLWRYMPGDTVMFTSTEPYKIVITGRTKHFINAFGEEVMVSNTDNAISRACGEKGVKIREYMVAPIYLDATKKGGHQWLVEFEGPTPDLVDFAQSLDRHLQEINSDYEAKRFQDLALECLTISSLPENTFEKWLRTKGKIGAQVKVPRLSNNRANVEEILGMLKKQPIS
jgi:hypothetical protein